MDTLERLLRGPTLATLALGFALGWALLQFASALGRTVVTLFTPTDSYQRAVADPLTWSVGDHLLALGPLVESSIALAVILGVALFIRRRYRRDSERNFVKRS